MRRYSLSVGILDLSIDLLKLIKSNPSPEYEEVKNILHNEKILFREYGQIVLDSAINFGWLEIDWKNNLILEKTLINLDLEEEIQAQRELLWLYILNIRPIWTIHLSHGINQAKQRISGVDEKQIFWELGLFPDSKNSTKEVLSWWNRARHLARYVQEKKLYDIGSQGEFLSIKFERKRTGITPEHKPLESDEFGYDILSQVSKSIPEPLYIEVKSSEKGWKRASLFLTRNEYEKCNKYGESYQFHLWDLSSELPRLLILHGASITPHVPTDSGNGYWKIVEIKFKNFDWNKSNQIGWN